MAVIVIDAFVVVVVVVFSHLRSKITFSFSTL